jgi:hypothetical protein
MVMLTDLLNEEIYLGSMNVAKIGDSTFRTSVLSTVVTKRQGIKLQLGLTKMSRKS